MSPMLDSHPEDRSQMTCKRLLTGHPELALAIFLVLSAACAHPAPPGQQRMPPRTQDRPLPDRIRSGERSERESWQKPEEVVQALSLKNGDVVADIGAGTGYFARRFARAVAPDGKVYAVDVAADVLAYLQQEAGKEGLPNIVSVVSMEDDPMLPGNAVDLAFFCDTTHHIANRRDFYRRMLSGLKEHGRMAIIDYPPGGEHAPHPPEQLVPRSQVIGEAEEAGFKLVEEFPFLPRQYFLLFERR
jgi:arsenite methyltransferase